MLAALGIFRKEGYTENAEHLIGPVITKTHEILASWTTNGPPSSFDGPKEAAFITEAVNTEVLGSLYDQRFCPPVYDGILPFVAKDKFSGMSLPELIDRIHSKHYVTNGPALFKTMCDVLRGE